MIKVYEEVNRVESLFKGVHDIIKLGSTRNEIPLSGGLTATVSR